MLLLLLLLVAYYAGSAHHSAVQPIDGLRSDRLSVAVSVDGCKVAAAGQNAVSIN